MIVLVRILTIKKLMKTKKEQPELNNENGALIQSCVITSFNDILGLSEPYSLDSVLEKLIEASEILLHQKNYDGHGWEIISEAVTQARNYKNKINSYLRQINE